MGADDDGDRERVARRFYDDDQRILELLKSDPRSDAEAQSLERSLRVQSGPVQAWPPSAYALPDHAARILRTDLLVEIESILGLVREWNDELVGTNAGVATLLIEADSEVNAIRRQRLRAWANSYVAERLRKPNSKDHDDPVLRFDRLHRELVPALERIAFGAPASVHALFLGEGLLRSMVAVPRPVG